MVRWNAVAARAEVVLSREKVRIGRRKDGRRNKVERRRLENCYRESIAKDLVFGRHLVAKAAVPIRLKGALEDRPIHSRMVHGLRDRILDHDGEQLALCAKDCRCSRRPDVVEVPGPNGFACRQEKGTAIASATRFFE